LLIKHAARTVLKTYQAAAHTEKQHMADHKNCITLKLMAFNILRDGVGEGGDRREQIAAVIAKHDPDILCMQEGGDNAYWFDMAKTRGFKHVQNVPGEFQPSLFAKRKVKAIVTHSGVKFVYFQINLGRFTLGVYSVHLMHWPPAEAERVAALHKLLSLMQAQGDALVCIAGDFNSRTRGEEGLDWGVKRIAEYNKCTIRRDDWTRATDMMALAGFVDCYRRLNTSPGLSLHPLADGSPESGADVPDDNLRRVGDKLLMPPVVRIDYVFVNPALAERLVSCEFDDSGDAFEASDHLPLIATFKI
jgi:endonuclease/exonuclease/phosphatase family metal-dependent hydrolase